MHARVQSLHFGCPQMGLSGSGWVPNSDQFTFKKVLFRSIYMQMGLNWAPIQIHQDPFEGAQSAVSGSRGVAAVPLLELTSGVHPWIRSDCDAHSRQDPHDHQ